MMGPYFRQPRKKSIKKLKERKLAGGGHICTLPRLLVVKGVCTICKYVTSDLLCLRSIQLMATCTGITRHQFEDPPPSSAVVARCNAILMCSRLYSFESRVSLQISLSRSLNANEPRGGVRHSSEGGVPGQTRSPATVAVRQERHVSIQQQCAHASVLSHRRRRFQTHSYHKLKMLI